MSDSTNNSGKLQPAPVKSLKAGSVGGGLKPAPVGTQKKATTAKPKSAAKTPADVLLSLGQSAIDTLSTPLYFVEGAIKAGIEGKNPLEAGAENAVSWTKGKRPVTGVDVIKAINANAAKNAPKGQPKNIGADILGLSQKDATAMQEGLGGLAADILLDPTNLIPGKSIATAGKVASEAAKAGLAAGKLAATEGKISSKIAESVAAKPLRAAEELRVGKVGKPTPVEKVTIQGRKLLTPENIMTPAGKAYIKSQEKIAKNTYTAVKVEAPTNVGKAVSNVLASSFEAATKAAKNTINAARTTEVLAKLAKKEAKAIRTADEFAVTPEVAVTPTELPTIAKPSMEGIAPKVDTAPPTTASQLPAEALIKTPEPKEVKAAQAVLDNLDKLAQKTTGTFEKEKVAYSSFDGLINGLREGHSIPTPKLEAIVNAIDPEAKWARDVAELSKKDANALYSGLVSGPGVQTVMETRRNLRLLTSEVMYKNQGMANADLGAAYTREALNPVSEVNAAKSVGVQPEAVKFESTAEAAARIDKARYEGGPADRLGGSQIDRATNAIRRAWGVRFKQFEEISKAPNFWQGLTSMEDFGVRSTDKAFKANNRALLKLQVNQFYETEVIKSLLGIVTYREGQAVAKGTLKAEPQSLRMNRFISDMRLVQDNLQATLSSRFVQRKIVQKGVKSEPHFVYLHLGDVMAVFRDTGASDAMYKAFFPEGPGIVRKTDGLDFVAVNNTVRHVLEMTEKNIEFTKEELINMLSRRGTKPNGESLKASKAFMDTVPALTDEIATHLMDAKVIEKFQGIHNARMIAAIDEAAATVEPLTHEIFDNLYKAWQLNTQKGNISEAERVSQIRELFKEFVFLADSYKQQDSDIAESVVHSAIDMYVSGNKLEDIYKTGKYAAPNLVDVTEAGELMDLINGWSKLDAPNKIGKKIASSAVVTKVTRELKAAELAYEAARKAYPAIQDKAALAAWTKDFNATQKTLDAARKAAQDAGVGTRHWMPISGWVATPNYNHALAIKEARQAGRDIKDTISGPVNVAEIATDAAPTTAPKIARGKAAAKINADSKLENIKVQLQLRAAEKQESAALVLGRLAEIEKQFPNEADQAEALIQQYHNEVFKAGQTSITRPQEPQTLQLQGVYGKPKATQLSEGEVRTLRQRWAERWNMRSGRQFSSAYLVQSQAKLNSAVQHVAHTMDTLINKYNNVVGIEDFHIAFDYAKSGAEIPSNLPDGVIQLAQELKPVLQGFFGEHAMLKTSGLDGKSIEAAFKRFGLGATGIPNVSNWTSERLSRLIDELPFGSEPKYVGEDAGFQKELWKQQRDALIESKEHPLLLMSRMVQAIEFAKNEKHLVQTWHSEFNYAVEGLTREQAIAKGYVKIGNLSGTTDLTKHLPEDGLYHPVLAREFASLNREWNVLYNSKKMPGYVNTMMEILNVLKATQTIFRPGHHVTNMVGDTSTAIIGGARDVRQWAYAYQMAFKWAKQEAIANYGADKLANSLARSLRHLEGKPNKLMGKEGSLEASFVIGGKKVTYRPEDLALMFEQDSVIVGNMIISDQRALQESVSIAEGTASGSVKELMRVAGEKFHQGFMKLERPAGDFAAAYGNAPRIASALHIAQSRAWKSEAEMRAAIVDHVARYHPTTYSLSATERRYPRLLFSYYTWLRGAHNALFDMAMNHTAAMTLYSKLQYNAARSQGQEPQSIGTPWGDKAQTPSYMNYSVYGPTVQGPEGPMLFKPAILPLDVIDTWNVQFDSTRTLDENFVNNIGTLGQSVGGKNVNFLLQPGLEWLTKTDPATGRPSKIKDFATLSDRAISMVGTTQLLKGLGLYTPSDKGPEAANPLTDRQRQVTLSNFFTGLRAQDINTPANIKNAQTEANARAKRAWENLQKGK